MPIARGIMQMGRINVYPTTTTLVSINPPSVGFCGDLITFTVTVSNNRGIGFPTPTGTVLIKDSLTNTTLASGSLSGGTAIIASTISISNNEIYAQYVGVVNQFGTSQSASVPYSISLIGTTITITNTPGTNFCFHNSFNLSVHVARTASLLTPVTVGNIQINLYTDPVSFTTIGIAPLGGTGDAIVVLPADTTIPGNNYYIQATYLGASCFGTSNSPIGTNGTLIHSVSLTQNITTTIAHASGGTPAGIDSAAFCINASKTFTAIISSSLGGPSVGSVIWTAFKSPTTIFLGIDFSVVAGNASITVPSATFPSTGTWTVTAAYAGDGYCFSNSVSANLSVNPSRFTVNIFLHGAPTLFCRAQQQIFEYDITSSLSGTISGTFVLKSSLGYDLGSHTLSGSNVGFIVQFIVPANTTAIGPQNVFLQFTPAVGSCYNSATGSNLAINVKSSANQSPASTTLSISPANGSSATTFMFTITIQKGGGTGPLDGAGSLNGTASLYWFNGATLSYVLLNNNINIFDNGTYGSGSYSASGFPSSATNAKAIWNGNSCYGFQESPSVPMSIFNPPH